MSSKPGGGRVESSRYRAVIELAALDKSDFDKVLRQILTTDARELGVDRVNCWTLEDRGIRCVAGYLRKEDRFEAGTMIEASTCPSYFRALADDPIILADDARNDIRTREFTSGYLVPLGITSMMDVPVWVRGRLWGVVCHEHVGPARRWTDAERDFAISIGHIVSMAVEARERADAERTTKFSEFFMGVLSHDLRAPLASIRAAADLMIEQGDKARAGTIVRNTDHMMRMIEQLLDFTRIRVAGGGIPIIRAPIDLAKVARDAADLDERVALQTVGDTNGVFDVDRIWQVFSNLMTNALTHGSPTGRVRVIVDGNRADKISIKVINHGSIAGDVLPVIFDPFRRPPTRTDKRKTGLGLGLFVVHEIVAAHDGSIVVDSDGGEVTFTVTLPRHPPHR
jgi:signal transduction histidine kinase